MNKKRKRVDKHKRWMAQLNDAYAGKSLLCPYCGKRTGKASFFFFPNGIGFGRVKCSSCGINEELLSRMEKSDLIKCPVTEMPLLENINTSKG